MLLSALQKNVTAQHDLDRVSGFMAELEDFILSDNVQNN